jgi:hypothetical protein
MKLMLHTSIVFTCMVSLYADQVSLSGPYLVQRNYGTIAFENTGDGSVFLTSSLGNGYQYELGAGQSVVSTVGTVDSSEIECQKPFGVPMSCAVTCQRTRSPAMGTTECTGVIKTKYSVDQGTDLLNEVGSHNALLNVVFLDTVINQGSLSFEVAVTNAPLYAIKQNEKGQLVTDPEKSIAGALDNGLLSIFNNIHGDKNITLGSQTYPVNFLTDTVTNPDGRFTFGTGTKKHMAATLLALDATTNHGVQTIIFIPTNFNNSCQPVIFVGRDKENTFYALTYLSNHATRKGGIVCCADANNNPCAHDTLYTLVSVNEDPRIVIDGQRARLQLTLGHDKTLGSDYVVATNLSILPGLWWPGQRDFSQISFAPVSFAVKTASRAPRIR